MQDTIGVFGYWNFENFFVRFGDVILLDFLKADMKFSIKIIKICFVLGLVKENG